MRLEWTLVGAVLAGALGVSIPALRDARERAQDLACVRNLIAACEGRLPKGARCPVGGEAYGATAMEAGARVASCPAREPHLPSRPRFERTAQGEVWRVLQVSPPSRSEGEGGLSASWTRTATVTPRANGVVRVEVGPAPLAAYGVAPALGLAALGCALVFAAAVVWTVRTSWSLSRTRGGLGGAGLGGAVGVIVCSAVWCAVAAYGAARQGRTETVDLRQGGAIFGSAPDEVVPVTACVPLRSGDERVVVLLDAVRPVVPVELLAIAPERLGELAPLYEALWVPPPTVRGHLDAVTISAAGVLLQGWVQDDAEPTRTVAIRVYAGGEPAAGGQRVAHTRRVSSRPDVNEATGLPGDFGFEAVIAPGAQGPFVVCAVDVACGEVPLRQGPNVGSPVGAFGGVRDGVAYGWSLDPDAPAAHLAIQLYLRGSYGKAPPVATGLANRSSPVVNRDVALSGDHGFAVSVPPEAQGRPVDVYAVNVLAGRDRLLGTRE